MVIIVNAEEKAIKNKVARYKREIKSLKANIEDNKAKILAREKFIAENENL